ncbi:hypothetical protein OAO01_05825 [Oligoflexia bacterium]|nr:hypothetical protein [Oligoflexia bacterium]
MNARIDFVKNPSWKVEPVKDFTLFFENLSVLAPEDAVLFIEGTSMAQDVKEFLHSKSVEAPQDIKVGEGPDPEDLPPERSYKVPLIGGELRVFPRSDRFHIPAMHEHFLEIAKMSEHHAEIEMLDSLIVYRENVALLHWYDTPTDPIYVSTEISEVSLQKFCAKVHVGYVLEN